MIILILTAIVGEAKTKFVKRDKMNDCLKREGKYDM